LIRRPCEAFVQRQDHEEDHRGGDMIVYRAVPYLVLAAAPVIVLITLLIAGCTMTRTANDPPTEVRGSIPTAMAGLAKS
jgi:hypothetical protein